MKPILEAITSQAFIITFRECLEATLIVGIVYTFLSKTKMHNQIKYLWAAVIAAITGSIAIAFILNSMFSSIQNEVMQTLFEAIFIYITAGLLLYVVFWLSKSISDREKLEQLASDASKSSKWGIFFLIFFAILREGFETVIFLFGAEAAGGTFSYLGFSLGAIIACIIGYLVFVQGKRINLKPFFAVTTLFLVLFAAGMSAYGTHEIESYIKKTRTAPINEKIASIDSQIKESITVNPTNMTIVDSLKNKKKALEIDLKNTKKDFEENFIKSRPWNILEDPIVKKDTIIDKSTNKTQIIEVKKYHILHDKGDIGIFLKGFLGYNSNPNWIELFVWIITLIFGLSIWSKYYLKSKN